MCDFCNKYNNSRGGYSGCSIKCKSTASGITDIDNVFILRSSGDEKAGFMMQDKKQRISFIDINYCPICGRKLE